MQSVQPTLKRLRTTAKNTLTFKEEEIVDWTEANLSIFNNKSAYKKDAFFKSEYGPLPKMSVNFF